MNDIQKAAIAKAEASMKPALDLYESRNKLMHLVCRLEKRDLDRLNDLVGKLSDDELRRVAVYAEGLAEWHDPDASSPDASARSK